MLQHLCSCIVLAHSIYLFFINKSTILIYWFFFYIVKILDFNLKIEKFKYGHFEKLKKDVFEKIRMIGSNLLYWSDDVKFWKRYSKLHVKYNIFQFLRSRYGIGSKLANLMISYTGFTKKKKKNVFIR